MSHRLEELIIEKSKHNRIEVAKILGGIVATVVVVLLLPINVNFKYLIWGVCGLSGLMFLSVVWDNPRKDKVLRAVTEHPSRVVWAYLATVEGPAKRYAKIHLGLDDGSLLHTEADWEQQTEWFEAISAKIPNATLGYSAAHEEQFKHNPMRLFRSAEGSLE
ncbi:MAG: hypothetical protein KC609_24465 [Myxococcales bacterium]|nr:hypothetical protein [Myxococcales bacterium]